MCVGFIGQTPTRPLPAWRTAHSGGDALSTPGFGSIPNDPWNACVAAVGLPFTSTFHCAPGFSAAVNAPPPPPVNCTDVQYHTPLTPWVNGSGVTASAYANVIFGNISCRYVTPSGSVTCSLTSVRPIGSSR